MTKRSISPYWAILIGIFSISSSAIFVKFAAAPSIVTAFYRMLFTSCILTPIILRMFICNRKLLDLSTKQITLSGISGIFFALHFGFWITSLNYTSITSSTVIVTLQPLFVMAGGYLFYREKVSYTSLLGAAISICGGIILGFGDMNSGSNALLGDFLALAGSFFIACYLLIGSNIRKQMHVIPYTYIVYFSASIVLLFGSLITGQPLAGYPPSTWSWFFAMAVVPNILGQTVFSWALKYVKTAVVSVSILGEPAGATILAFIIWNQIPRIRCKW
ncbi:MAG TPA: DMT family transporter [Methylomusa anaerophila]|uniref:EamA-like transporter family protein n=1 Tax=Methylomusa anaerophila TaxID=1930071 RepID=A0A348AH46_9FIRM|nr:DMT family transporter [Methylomusa anaerophila]BBB90394.1 EamA-like transporter family protein [Methylomusa anaerophila]HML90392.1 DMT family transporter [Methylomusa anaerophila]